jgi:hypothetical protein
MENNSSEENIDKNASIELLRELSNMIERGDIDEKCIAAIKQISCVVENYKSIDKQMVELLHSIFSNGLNKKDAYEEVVKSVEEGSVIVYFKSAQLFKVYKKDDIINLLDGQLRTDYKHIQDSYEVIPKNSEQKIIIMGDVSLLDKLDSIKEYIRTFMINKGINEFKVDDIICFKNTKTDMLEIIINNYYVNNSEERNIIVHDLLAYIVDIEKNNIMSRKLGPPSGYSDIKGVDIITMPSEKQLINEETRFVEMIDRLVRRTDACTKIVKEGNIYNVYIQNADVINNGDIVNNNSDCTLSTTSNDYVYDFIKHIREIEPDWYIENTWIKKDILYDNYISLYGEITKKAFSIMFKDKLYKMENRKMVNKTRFVFIKLFKISEL